MNTNAWIEKIFTKENVFLVFLIVLEFLLFKNYALREVVDVMPRNYDQAVYLRQTYDVYDYIVRNDWHDLIRFIKDSVTNSGLVIFNAIWLFVFGHSRLTLLSTNFFFFATMQLVGYKVIKNISNSFSMGIALCGLFMMTGTIFTYVGDILDYRWDFPAFCMYTIWGLLILLWLHFDNKKQYFIYSAIAAGILIFVRFYYAIFVAIFIVGYYFMCILTNKVDFKKAIQGIITYGLICIFAGGWCVFVFAQNVVHYIITAANSGMTAIWQPVMTTQEKITFYINNFFSMHLKISFIIATIFCVVISCIITFRDTSEHAKKQLVHLYGMLTIFIMPSVFFLLQSAKNQSVLSLNAGIIGVICIYALETLLKTNQIQNYHIDTMIQYLVVIIFFIGLINYVKGTISPHIGYNKTEDQAATRINAAIVDYMQEHDLEEMRFVMDRHSDVIYADTMQIYSYEKYKEKITCNEISDYYKDGLYVTFDLSTEICEEHLLDALNNATFIIANNTEYLQPAIYPLDQSLEGFREEIHEYANHHMIPITTEKFAGGLVTVYARETGIIAGGYSDGWMGIKNVAIHFKKTFENQKQIIVEGICEKNYLQDINVNINGIDNTKVTLDETNNSYNIQIDISKLSLGEYTCLLEFDNYFIPSNINSNSCDNRKLVLPIPNKIEIVN